MKDSEFEKIGNESVSFMEQLKTLTSERLKAPEGFAEAVMNSIYKLGRTEPDTAKIRAYFSRLYRNVGVSLVLASLAAVLILFVPGLNFYESYVLSHVQSGSAIHQTSGIKENLAGMNTNINGIFNSINNCVTRFKEGI